MLREMRLFALFRKWNPPAALSLPLLAISHQSGESVGFRRPFSGRVICFEGVRLDGKGGLTPFSFSADCKPLRLSGRFCHQKL